MATIVLGIDPGIADTGYGVIEIEKNNLNFKPIILSIIFFKLEYRRILYEHKHKHRSS